MAKAENELGLQDIVKATQSIFLGMYVAKEKLNINSAAQWR